MQYGTPEAQRAKGNTGFGPGDMNCDLTSVYWFWTSPYRNYAVVNVERWDREKACLCKIPGKKEARLGKKRSLSPSTYLES